MPKRKSSWSQSTTPPARDERHTYPSATLGSGNIGGQSNFPQDALFVPQMDEPSGSSARQDPGGFNSKRIRQNDGNVVEILSGITRKITACAACRKNKIRCDMPEEGPPCVRCRRRGLSCVLSRSLQSLLEDMKNTMLIQDDVKNLHDTLSVICNHLDMDMPKPLTCTNGVGNAAGGNGTTTGSNAHDDSNKEDDCEVSPPQSPSAVQAPIDTFLDIAKLGSPRSGEGHMHHNSNKREVKEDLVSKGIITMESAERLVESYFSRLDHYLYGIGGPPQDASKLRTTSPILFAAICTVSALHDPGDHRTYVACNREFRHLISRSLFEKKDIEYIRALCISSFWLTDASRIFSSDAIRRAGDMRLHRSFEHLLGLRAPSSVPSPSSTASPSELSDRVRLWYLLFVCDQHLSVLHNRDPLLRSDNQIAVSWESYLDRAEATESDVRILSQVSLLLIMGQVRDVLGSDNETQLPQALSSQILGFSRQLDRWFSKFSSLFVTNSHIGDFPTRGLQLHYQFGKLYLGHQVFKGLHGKPIPTHLLRAAAMAHEAATTTFEMILSKPELQQGLVGMPHYFHIMIAFAGHFLLEVCRNYREQLAFRLEDEFSLINRVLTLFRNTPCIPQHPLSRMTGGLTRKMLDCAAELGIQDVIGRQSDAQLPFTYGMPAGNGPVGADMHLLGQTSLHVVGDVSVQPPAEDLFLPDLGEFSFPDLTSNFAT
ncbi:hypothetical protein BDV59DRAFT_205607 [Aspergillus ambiguus]|uniref:Zn(II)2Cys6 transcription factor n=1 Tax=Aspergillus ambiguus TaxID=176160 RepID=UPI003CCD304A